MTGVKAVWGSRGIILWDVYHKGVWLGSRRTYVQAIKELDYERLRTSARDTS